MPSENNMEMVELFHRLGKQFGEWGNCPELRRSEWGALFFIFRSQNGNTGVKTSQISRQMEVSPPALTPTLNQLEQKGLIERRPGRQDRRTVYLYITPQGQDLCQRQRQRLDRRFEELSRYLGEEDSRELVRLLKRVFRYSAEGEEGHKTGTAALQAVAVTEKGE